MTRFILMVTFLLSSCAQHSDLLAPNIDEDFHPVNSQMERSTNKTEKKDNL